MCERLHRLVYRRTLKNKTKQRETNKSRRRGFQIITVSVGNLHFRAKKYSTVLEATTTCKQITKSASTLGEMILGLPERRDDNKLGNKTVTLVNYFMICVTFLFIL